ncbi:MAG TPA: sigma-70 family RNA polymerase sigma factor [Solirubrobacteraceae bacterium]
MDERDPEAFRALYRAHYRTVCRYLAARTERDLVEDIAAETFLVAWRKQAEMPGHVVPWLLNTASKCLANQRRSKARADALIERLGELLRPGASTIEERIAQQEQLQALLAALTTLSERELELLLLSYWDGLAPREIAEVLELSPVLLRARLHRASRRLQQALASELGHERPHSEANRLAEALDLAKPERT